MRHVAWRAVAALFLVFYSLVRRKQTDKIFDIALTTIAGSAINGALKRAD